MRGLVFPAFILMALLGTVSAQSRPPVPCAPPIHAVELHGSVHPQASERIAELYQADQEARYLGSRASWEAVAAADRARREEALPLLEQGLLGRGIDFYRAAMIFQHGACPAHYELAHRLAQRALDVGYTEARARWLYAASLDQYLLSLGRKQKYGTQYTHGPCGPALLPVDPETTDEERIRYHVPPLESLGLLDHSQNGSSLDCG